MQKNRVAINARKTKQRKESVYERSTVVVVIKFHMRELTSDKKKDDTVWFTTTNARTTLIKTRTLSKGLDRVREVYIVTSLFHEHNMKKMSHQ